MAVRILSRNGTIPPEGWKTVAVSTTYSVGGSDQILRCNASGGAFVVTLPAVAKCLGRILHIKKVDSSANAVTIDGNASEQVEDANSQDLMMQGESLMLRCNGTSWDVI